MRVARSLAELIEDLAIGIDSAWRPRTAAPPIKGAGTLIGKQLELDGLADGHEVWLTPGERSRHTYVLGATGCGKTNLLMRFIESDIASNRCIGVIDLRGDLVDRISARLASIAGTEEWDARLVLVDLREQKRLPCLNPLAGSGYPHSRAYHVLSVLKQGSESWGVQLEETLRNSLIALAEAGGTLLDVEPLLSDAEIRAQVIGRVTDPYVCSFFGRYDALGSERQQTWRLPVLNKVTPLLGLSRLRRILGAGNPLDLRQLIDRPGIVLLIALAVDQLHEAAHLLGGLILSSLQLAVMSRVNKPEAERRPFSLYVDEFETMATPSFAALIAEGRRFGLSLTLCHQNLSQLPLLLRNAVRNNAHLQFFFQTGSTDAGELSREVVGLGDSQAIRKVLMSLPVGQALLLRRGLDAIRVRVEMSPEPRAQPERVANLRDQALAQLVGQPDNSIGFARPLAKGEELPEVRHARRPRL